MRPITHLMSNEVFVYGSNRSGFSGAGAAGLAVRGTAANTWRTDPWVAKARAAPVGHPDRVGKWAVWGVARGWSQGREGMGYAIQTIERPGLKRSTPLSEIQKQMEGLLAFAASHTEWRFLMTPVGTNLAGYTSEEMLLTWATALARHGGLPLNVIARDLYSS